MTSCSSGFPAADPCAESAGSLKIQAVVHSHPAANTLRARLASKVSAAEWAENGPTKLLSPRESRVRRCPPPPQSSSPGELVPQNACRSSASRGSCSAVPLPTDGRMPVDRLTAPGEGGSRRRASGPSAPPVGDRSGSHPGEGYSRVADLRLRTDRRATSRQRTSSTTLSDSPVVRIGHSGGVPARGSAEDGPQQESQRILDGIEGAYGRCQLRFDHRGRGSSTPVDGRVKTPVDFSGSQR